MGNLGGNAFDAIVAGAGPSGSACAALMAEKGCRVLLLDKEKFPRDKPCGDAIGGKALNVLKELGLEKELEKKGFLRQSGIVFSSPAGDEVEIPLAAEGKEMSGGVVCRRLDFDNIVFQNAKKKCVAVEECEVTDVIFENGKAIGVKTKAKDGEEQEFRAKLIIGADGTSSVVARKTLAWKLDPVHTCSAVRAYYTNIGGLRGNIEVHFLKECMNGYFWIFPLSRDIANVGVGMLLSDISKKKLNLTRVLDACLANQKFAPRFANAKLESPVRGWSLPLASAHRKCAGNGWILLGDAASLIDPFSGEGIGNGMKSAKIAADTLGGALLKGEATEKDCLSYESALWKEIGADIASSYSMQKLGRNEWLLNYIIGKAKRSKWVQQELAGMIANKEAKKKATDPLFYLRMLLS